MPADSSPPTPDRTTTRLLVAYALANVAVVIAYLPLLTLLLPLKIATVAGGSAVDILTVATLAGAVAASIANIAFGWLSDRTVAHGGTRRGWVAMGLLLTILGYAAINAAQRPVEIVVAVTLWQVALNALVAPLFAMMADDVPDARKGIAGALLTLANPTASTLSWVLAMQASLGEGARYAVIVAVVAALLAPLLALRAQPPVASAGPETIAAPIHGDIALAWLARLLVQVAGAVLFVYLLLYFARIGPGSPPAAVAPAVGRMLAIGYAVAIPLAFVAGRLSDRAATRRPILGTAPIVAATGLVVMALAASFAVAATGFMLYVCGSAVFLALQSTAVMRMLPVPERRGRTLGFLNLANTLPAVVGPALAWSFGAADGFTPILIVLAAMTCLAGGLALAIDYRAPS